MIVRRYFIAYTALDNWKLFIGVYKDDTTKHCVYYFIDHNVHSDVSRARILSSIDIESWFILSYFLSDLSFVVDIPLQYSLIKYFST